MPDFAFDNDASLSAAMAEFERAIQELFPTHRNRPPSDALGSGVAVVSPSPPPAAPITEAA